MATIEYRRCLGGRDGSVYTIENAAGRAAKGVRSLVCRYRTPSSAPEILYPCKERLQDGLWLSPEDHVYCVSSSGGVHTNRDGKWAGVRVSRHPLGAIWGLHDRAILAGGVGGAEGIFRFDGARWWPARVERGLEHLERSATVLAFGATGPDDLYVVAKDPFERPQKCSLIHFDGSVWTPLEMRRAGPGRRTTDLASRGIPQRINSIYCRSRDEVFLCGDAGLLMQGNARDGWKQIGGLRRNQKPYCPAEVNGKLYFAHSEPGQGGFGIISWDGAKIEVIRSDILPWHLAARNGRLYVTWRAGFGVFDGTRWQIRGQPDVPARGQA